jgi:tetratricopeptide (TPR) repeat protein
MGLAYEAMGESAKAREHFEKAAVVPSTKYRPSGAALTYEPDILFHRGRAAQKLGRTSEAQALFDRLIESGRQALAGADDSRPDYFAKFGERDTRELRLAQGHYVLGLGYLGAGKPQEARTEFEQAIKLNVNHLEAQVQLANLGDSFN